MVSQGAETGVDLARHISWLIGYVLSLVAGQFHLSAKWLMPEVNTEPVFSKRAVPGCPQWTGMCVMCVMCVMTA